MAIINLDKENFDSIKKEGKVLVDFYATWCGPCKMLGPVLEEFADTRSEVNIIKVDIDEHPEIAQNYGVMSVPTVILFENGEEKDKFIGFKPLESIEEFVED